MPRPTRAEIIIPNLVHNLDCLKRRVGPAVQVMPVIKADAYGHGALDVARSISERCRSFAVACLEEALELREGGIENDIVILGPLLPGEIGSLVERNISILITHPDDLGHIGSFFSSSNKSGSKSGSLRSFVHVDTGMGRLGLLPEQFPSVLNSLDKMSEVSIEGIFSHFPVADGRGDEDLARTRSQIKDFELIWSGCKKRGSEDLIVSIANSAGVLFHTESACNCVRAGIALYGSMPSCELDRDPELRPAMRLVTEIVQIRELPPGSFISYGGRTRLDRPSRIGVMPVGYADGLNRRLPPGFEFFVKGRPAPLMGVITMDLSMIDLTDLSDARIGDRVLLMGTDEHGAEVPAEKHAAAAGTIPYEILTSVSKRVSRRYLR